jgi:hypothetical protein
LGAFVAWAVIGDNPFGGEPMVTVPIDVHAAAQNKNDRLAAAMDAAGPQAGPAAGPPLAAAPASATPAANSADRAEICGDDGAQGHSENRRGWHASGGSLCAPGQADPWQA